MTISRVFPGDFETFTIATNPTRTYTSSSTLGVTGSVYVFARRSTIEKETQPSSVFVEQTHDDTDLESTLQTLRYSGRISRYATGSLTSSFNSMMTSYLDAVNAQSSSPRKQKVLEVNRFTPSVNFTSNTLRKLVIKDQLNTFYRTVYPSAHWAYTNYNTLNFFTSSNTPTGSALLYPATDSGPEHDGYVTGSYSLSGAFSFDFYINPRYTALEGETFHAGTVYHLSSSYAVSLISGSGRDENGSVNGFRLQLQLSHSADTAPSLASAGTYPSDLIFLSDDNALKLNNWHHVVIRWGTSAINDGTGSFNIDGVDKGYFVVPSGTVAPLTFGQTPNVLAIGNFFEGWDDMQKFFAYDTSTRDGLLVLDATTSIEEPDDYSFNHPLNAEVHDLSIKRYYMSDLDITTSASVGPKSIDNSIAFYLPPFFVPDAPFRKFYGDHGGILQTPFFEIDGTTDDPFNVAMSFGVNGHYINIENFLRDFASDVFPRTHMMTGTALTYTTEARTANEFLYDDPFVVRRNTLIMPCDDGLFVPAYELLASESRTDLYVDDLGVTELSFINLDNLLATSSFVFGTTFSIAEGSKTTDEENAYVDELIGFTPEYPGKSPGRAVLNYKKNVSALVSSGTYSAGVQDSAPLTIYQRTRDASSNQITVFDISNLYYGMRIHPGSLSLTDTSLSGTNGTMSITLKDDSYGNIYRADCLTSQSKWTSVGNVYYDEGLVLIKSPHLYHFGSEQYELTFKGEQNVHMLNIESIARSNELNSSSNPDFLPISASLYPNDPDKDFVYITGLRYLDDNFNVVMKADLAQPIMKRTSDRIGFRVRLDF